jgi:Firmicute plasmid replication protein (RepL)
MNPFLNLQRLKLIEVTKSKSYIAKENIDEGIIVGLNQNFTFSNSFFVEQDKKVSLYKGTNVRSMMLQLTSPALRLFVYIAYTLPENSDIIHLPYKKVAKHLGLSLPTYYKAVNELAENQIIAKQKKEYYWINPVHLFNGNKINFFREHCPECIDIVAQI